MSDHVVRVLATSLASAALALGAPALSSARPIVVNPDSSGAIPWQALVLQMSGGSVTGLCGGTVRDQLHVITAAHCVVDEATGQVIAASSFGVVGGLVHVSNPEPDRQPRAVTTVSVDPDFTVTAGALLNDAAILTLDQPLDLSNPASVRALPPVAAGGTGTVALISGFGLTDPANNASLADVRDDARLLKEEIFGPVAPVRGLASEEEAIAAANDTEYGLVAYVYTSDIKRAFRVIEGLQTGMVGLNQGMVSNASAPFGGVKQSGFGREGGHEGMQEYLETKYVAMNVG